MRLTERQKIVLKKIHEFILENKYPPTIRELASRLGFSSPKGVTDHLKALERKGYIERKSSARSIKLTEKALSMSDFTIEKKVLSLPLIGRIAAGSPVLAEENVEEYISISASLLGKNKADFALRVRGNSMIGDHILDGDIIIAKSQSIAENGDIVVALIGDEAVVKRLYWTKDRVELRSSNPSYKTITINVGEDLRIQGKVVAIQRSVY